MTALTALLGKEHDLDEVNLALTRHIRQLAPPIVGALHLTCADESEWECAGSFQRCCVEQLLPDLKFAEKSPFRLSNLGGRHERGAIAVAEHHFAAPASHEAFKVLLVKVSAHVAVVGAGRAAQYGSMRRYDTTSTACGALHALLAGGEQGFLGDLRAAFKADGVDRLAVLLDEQQVEPTCRSLFVALVNAHRQLRGVEDEINTHKPASPTLYIVAACVTFNRPARDTELFAGLLTIDARTAPWVREYRGLGDDPAAYRVQAEGQRVRVTDAVLRS